MQFLTGKKGTSFLYLLLTNGNLVTYLVACVASVSNRVTTRKSEQEQKKKHSPPPPPSFHFFALVPTFELARKRLLRRLNCCKCTVLNPLAPKSVQHQFSPNNISRSTRVRLWELLNWLPKGECLYLKTNSLNYSERKCMEISLENLCVDLGA